MLRKPILILLASAAIAGLTCYLDPYYLHVLIYMFFYSYLCLCWNIIAGFGGQLSFGHPVFYGIGAYATAKLFVAFNLSPWFGMLAGSALAALSGLLIGFICFRYRLKGIFFALVTLAFAEIAKIVAMQLEILGGTKGLLIPLVIGNSLSTLQLSSKNGYFIWILAMTVFAVMLSDRIKNSRFGYYLAAIKDDEESAESLGINVNLYKLYGLIVSAAMTALAGSFHVQYTLAAHPEDVFGINLSIEIILRTIIGGIGSISGPIVGSCIMQPVGELTRSIFGGTQGVNLLIQSVFMGVVILVIPRGVVNLNLLGNLVEKLESKLRYIANRKKG